MTTTRTQPPARGAQTCTIDGCCRQAHAKDLCGAHLKRLQRSGRAGTAEVRAYGTPPFKKVADLAEELAEASTDTSGDGVYYRIREKLRVYVWRARPKRNNVQSP